MLGLKLNHVSKRGHLRLTAALTDDDLADEDLAVMDYHWDDVEFF